MCLCWWIRKYFLMLTYELNSYQNWMQEKKNWKMFNLEFYSGANNLSQSIYTSSIVSHQSILVPWKGNQCNFWCTHWVGTKWISNLVNFGHNPTVLKFQRLFFCLSDWIDCVLDLILYMAKFFNFWEMSFGIRTVQYFDYIFIFTFDGICSS